MRYLYLALCFALLCSFLLLWAVKDQKTELQTIEKKIAELREALHYNQQDIMRENLEAQSYMIADWEKYSQDIQDIRTREEEARKILRQIEELEKRKEQLLKQD